MTDVPTLFADLVRCETRLYNDLNEVLRARHDITAVVFELLRYLRDRPDARVADLAAEFAAGVGAISKGVDRQEKQGWVERIPNPDDRRSSLLRLTATGRRLVDAAEVTFTERATTLIGEVLGPREVTATAQALADLRAALERDEIGVPIG